MPETHATPCFLHWSNSVTHIRFHQGVRLENSIARDHDLAEPREPCGDENARSCIATEILRMWKKDQRNTRDTEKASIHRMARVE